MKKILAIICVITVLFSLTACGNNAETVQEESNSYSQIEQNTEPETSSTSDTVSETSESNIPTDESTTSDEPAESTAPTETSQQNTTALTEQAATTEPPATSETKPQTAAQTETKPAAQTETKPETQTEATPTAQIETQPVTQPETKPETHTEPPVTEEEPDMLKFEIIAGNKIFSATLYDNGAAKALMDMLPLTLDMSELNGNEKYYYLDKSLPTNASRPSGIKTGDIMLYGNSCLVLFYESFSTSYSYTPIGRIDDPAGLAAALGSGNVQVTFRKG